MENNIPFSRRPLFRFLTQPEVVSTISSITVNDVSTYYQKERPSDNLSTIYDAISKDLEVIIDSNFFNTDITRVLRNIRDTWDVATWGLRVTSLGAVGHSDLNHSTLLGQRTRDPPQNSICAINEKAPISKRPHENEETIISKKSVIEGTSSEDLLNSVTQASNAFRQIKFPTYYNKLKTIWHTRDFGASYYVIDLGNKEVLNQVHNLLDKEELEFLFERLSLEDENIHMSKIAREYMMLFDQILEDSSEEEEEGDAGGDVENGFKIEDEAVSEMEKNST
ncbi:16284_t:CDS:2 [Funneliformis caledonium]|uniref:16284_t:CDS:1 n=1 Tax=Funneliformis caledonium TaxID=1117310 RepID=A0A9N9HNJ9_9GLOM|nr:16284_t:CDS:2 [Funneliformis caledonium]